MEYDGSDEYENLIPAMVTIVMLLNENLIKGIISGTKLKCKIIFILYGYYATCYSLCFIL